MPEVRMALGALAAELGVSLATVNRWLEAGLPARKRGGRWRCDLEVVRAWRAKHERPPAAAAPEAPGRADAELRKANALADLRELELAKRRGEVLSREELRHALGDALYSLRSRLLSLPPQVAARCEMQRRREIELLLSAELTAALEEVLESPFAPADTDLLCPACRRERAERAA